MPQVTAQDYKNLKSIMTNYWRNTRMKSLHLDSMVISSIDEIDLLIKCIPGLESKTYLIMILLKYFEFDQITTTIW